MSFMMILGATSLIPDYIYNWMRPTLQILMSLVAIAVIVIVLMQKGTNDNIGAIGGKEQDTYVGKNKSRSKDNVLKTLTISSLAVELVFSILYFITFITL